MSEAKASHSGLLINLYLSANSRPVFLKEVILDVRDTLKDSVLLFSEQEELLYFLSYIYYLTTQKTAIFLLTF